MVPQEQPRYKRRILTSQFTTVISITLVLFLLGLFGLIMLHARMLSDYVRENVGISLMMNEDVNEAGILQLKKTLDGKPFVKSTEFITREKAAQKLKSELGEDFVGFLGYNPLLPSIELRIKAPYANPDSLALIEKKLAANPEIKEIFYQKSLVDAINSNIRKIGFVLLGFSALLLFIATVLINNTIRLSVYARRFIIRSMQLVGATEGFIRKPMLRNSILQGFLSALLALGLLMGLVALAVNEFPALLELQDPVMLIALVIFLFVLGIFISWIATWLAIRKYLRLSTDLLYQ